MLSPINQKKAPLNAFPAVPAKSKNERVVIITTKNIATPQIFNLISSGREIPRDKPPLADVFLLFFSAFFGFFKEFENQIPIASQEEESQ